MKKKKQPHDYYLKSWLQSLEYGILGGRPYSKSCVQNYKYHVSLFLKRHSVVSVANLKTTLLNIPVIHYAKREKMFSALNCFARFLIQEGQLRSDYLVDAKAYKPRRHLPPRKTSVDKQGIEKLIQVSDNVLDKMIVVLLSQTGLRASEASALKRSDLNFEKRFLTVRQAKWGKTRRVGLTAAVIQVVQDYLKVRPNVCHDHLLLNRNGGQMDRHGIQQRVQRLGLRAGVPASPHALRRAFVTINANQGKPLVMLQIACGHNDIATTRSYCMTTEDEVISAMAEWEW